MLTNSERETELVDVAPSTEALLRDIYTKLDATQSGPSIEVQTALLSMLGGLFVKFSTNSDADNLTLISDVSDVINPPAGGNV